MSVLLYWLAEVILAELSYIRDRGLDRTVIFTILKAKEIVWLGAL